MQVPFGFVVLNYLNWEETLACVASIRSLKGDGYQVVVVDNQSPNDSFDVLSERLKGDPKVEVLQSGRNGGYSFGNNVGIRALAARGIHDVVIATSDTRVQSADILARLAAARARGVGVVGPAVLGPDGLAQNPVLPALSLQYIGALHLGATWRLLKSLAFRLKLVSPPAGVPVTPEPTHGKPAPVKVYMVHGCFLYLSAHYLRAFPLLDEDLFMYGEEDLIAYNCTSRRLPVEFDPGVRVFHGDARSTGGGNFRNTAMDASMRRLKSKISVRKLLHAYFRAA